MNIPQSLIDFWQSNDRPCGLKNLEHQYVYLNDTYRQMLDLPKDFNVRGKFDKELSDSMEEIEDKLKMHDKMVVESKVTKSSLETHPVGKSKRLEAWVFHKAPFILDGEVVGIYVYAEPAMLLDMTVCTSTVRSSSIRLSLYCPDPRLTKREWEVVYFLLNHNNPKQISAKLQIKIETTRDYLKRIMVKVGVYSTSSLIALARKNGWHRYIPSRNMVNYNMLDV